MTRPLDRHLDSDEIDALISLRSTDVSCDAQFPGELAEEAQRHVDSCDDCHRKVQMHKSVQGDVLGRVIAGISLQSQDCLEAVEWERMAAGLLKESETTKLMKHAAQCGHCGPLLREAAATLSDDAMPAEEALVNGLPTARRDWQSRMAGTLHSNLKAQSPVKSAPWWKGPLFWPSAGLVLATVSLFLFAGWFAVRMLRPPSAERLLAEAYTERRMIEVRIPGAQYAPLRVERGTTSSHFDKPEALLKAEALISESLRKNPNDPTRLDAKARAELLDGDYDDAIATLLRALRSRPESPELLTDLGSAYFMRAKSADRPVDYGNAIEFLAKALAKEPEDPIALFNRALACEQLFLFTQAVDDWERYLRLDPQGKWSDEARERLSAVKSKIEHQRQSLREPLLGPAAIAGVDLADRSSVDRIDARIEEYQHLAISDWLPHAFHPDVTNANESLRALSTLGSILKERHQDEWLADLLRQPVGAPFGGGVAALATALKADDRGDYTEARAAAQRAAEVFAVVGNFAGQLRANAEEVYADHLLWEGGKCIALIQHMDSTIERHRYAWLQAQMSLERSNCANQIGDLGTYLSAIDVGVREAEAHHYMPLFVRGLGFEALAAASLGDAEKGFTLAARGLALFWSGRVDSSKGYNLYNHLDGIADGLGLPDVQVAVCREATVLLDDGPNLLKRAMAHSWYGKAAYLAGNLGLAASEFSKAGALFASSPQTAATTRDRLDAELWLANAEINQGEIDLASKRLTRAEPNLYVAPSFDPEMEYYTAEASLAMRRKDTIGAEAKLRSALFLSEWALDTFPDRAGRRRWAEQTREAYRDAVEWQLRRGDAVSALELWEWYKGADTRAARSPNQILAADDAMGAPPDARNAPPFPTPKIVTETMPHLRDKTMIAYAVFYDGVAIWVYDDRGIFSFWVAVPPQSVYRLVVNLNRLCSDPATDLAMLRSNASALYSLLLKPVEKYLDPSRTLVLEPDDILSGIPWEVLQDSRERYLVERFASVNGPGLYWQIHLQPAPPITSETAALVVTVPVAPAERMAPLADAEYEGQTVAGVFHASRWLRGQDATIAAIRRDLHNKGVFHFVGHAISSPQRSGLVLSEVDDASQHARLLTERSLSDQEMKSLRLAVLSACPPNSTFDAEGAQNDGLAGSFLRAGVPHVLASRWKVDSSQTAVFMAHFYQALVAGGGVAASKRTAQTAMASKPASAHPYYWAAFELQGTQ